MSEEIKKYAHAILELIEDKQYPAKRVIYDYIVDLVRSIDNSLGIELDKFGQEYFKLVDANPER